MKIAYVTSNVRDPNAGVSGATLNIGSAVGELGADVDFYMLDHFPMTRYPTFDKLLFPIRVSCLPSLQSYDVVDHSIENTILNFLPHRPLTVARSHGLEHVTHDRLIQEAKETGRRPSWKYPLYNGSIALWDERMSLCRADIALLLNKRDRDYAIQRLKVDADKAHIMPNGLPEQFIGRPFNEVHTGLGIKLAFIGGYIERKGISYLKTALGNILRRHPTVSITFLGTKCNSDVVFTDYDRSVHGQISVVPTYAQEDLPDLLAGHKIMLFPSLSEGFSLALLEAMACGLAPIVTDIPGTTDLCVDGNNAIVVPPANSVALELAIERLISEPKIQADLCRRAHQTAQDYSWVSIAERTLRMYEKGLRRKSIGHTNAS
jgi:glycosyltransferase involved in cell wall biosynthesis